MNNLLTYVENKQTSEFYPTPASLIEKMLSGIDWRYVSTVLEPSAGKGDIIREIAKQAQSKFYDGGSHLDVDCIELDANLRQILKYNFSNNRKSEIKKEIRDLEDLKNVWNEEKRECERKITRKQTERLAYLENESRTFFCNGIHIVHDNFLTYTAFKQYDIIVMNPPFSNGDAHLLKALEIQKNGGAVVCLLNAETLKNPYTETRKALVKILEQYDATVEYISNAFSSAERTTDVEVALVKVNIPKVNEESDIYNSMKKAEEYDEEMLNPSYEIEIADFIKAMVSRFKVEVRSGIELIKQFNAYKPYMPLSFDKDEIKYGCTTILDLTINGGSAEENRLSVNNYVKMVRYKYWRLLMANPKFVGKLTSKLQEEYRKMVNDLANYDFTEFNIATISAEMNSKVKEGIEDEIEVMYDRLTAEHSYYPETKNNRHYYDGWCTNIAHKIGKKVIIPCYGVFDSWDGKPKVYEAVDILSDIERILNYLDGGMTRDCDLWHTLDTAFKQGVTKNIPLKHFTATFYKKGTVHLTFTAPELIERYNIYVGGKRSWLPPSYGKKTYNEMTPEEKAVINGFQGEKAYNEVLCKKSYYLAPATSDNVLALTEAC